MAQIHKDNSISQPPPRDPRQIQTEQQTNQINPQNGQKEPAHCYPAIGKDFLIFGPFFRSTQNF